MARVCRNFSFTLDSTLGDTPEIPIGEYASGQINIPAASSITSLTYYASPTSGGTYLAAQDGSGALVQTVAASKSYQMPAAIFGAGNIKILTNADGAVTMTLKD